MNANAAPDVPTRQLNPRLIPNPPQLCATANIWKVYDASTVEFMRELYRAHGENRVNKAEALRSAQMAFISHSEMYSHPYYWAPFVLLGNWQ